MSTYSELIAKAALRIRTARTEPTDFLTAVADLLDQEADAAERCPGLRCPLLDCNSSDIDTRTHHHCRWCNEAEWPASIDVADAYLAETP